MVSACDKADLTGMFVTTESVDDRFEQSVAWNEAHSAIELVASTDDYSLYAMGDSHIGNPRNLDTLLQRAKENDIKAVVMVGDITTGKADQYEVLDKHIPSQDSIRTFFVAGNHDVYFGGWKEFYRRFGSSTYYFTVKTPSANDLYICLDTGSGTLGSKQLAWFKNVLETNRKEYRRCVVFTHNNLYRVRHTGSTNPVAEEIATLSELFLIHDVDMVITGHDHEGNVRVFGKTTHITMDALLVEYKGAGYFYFNVKNGEISFRFEKI